MFLPYIIPFWLKGVSKSLHSLVMDILHCPIKFQLFLNWGNTTTQILSSFFLKCYTFIVLLFLITQTHSMLYPVIWISCLFLICIWIFLSGVNQFCQDIIDMICHCPPWCSKVLLYFKACWVFCTPFLLLVSKCISININICSEWIPVCVTALLTVVVKTSMKLHCCCVIWYKSFI